MQSTRPPANDCDHYLCVYRSLFMKTRSATNPSVLISGILLATILTTIIALIADRLVMFEIVGRTVPFAYPWRLVDPTSWSRASAWIGYALHNLAVWTIIYMARRKKPGFNRDFRWYNWSMLGANSLFIGLHILQTHVFYDGLAQDVPEVTALGSVALMLMVVLILETPRRGLFFGKRLRFDQRFMKIVREYHGYFFSWAIIYTFWYHPTETTIGHLAGFFYMFMLLWQSVLIFNRAHRFRWWTVTLELLVIPHGVLVALTQPDSMWRMFGFGFAAIFILTQMHGLGLSRLIRSLLGAAFVVLALTAYLAGAKVAMMHEITRIPIIEYGVVGLLYVLFLVCIRLAPKKQH